MISLRNTVFILLFCLSLGPLLGQDTIFYQNHVFETPVRNVLEVKGSIYVKTGDGLYQYVDGSWELISKDFKKRYLFYADDFFETEFIPEEFTFEVGQMAHLIPQVSLANPTRAQLENSLFISVGGSLFEYQINTHYQRSYSKTSIRDIYIDDSIKVVSTYSGIFINDSIKVAEPSYSNGHFISLNKNYWLCADGLYRLNTPTEFVNTTKQATDHLGHFRKLVTYQGGVYAQLNISVARLDSADGWNAIHQNHQYTDIDSMDDHLYFVTDSGHLFRYDGKQVKQLTKLESRINDVYAHKNLIFLGASTGLFTYNPASGKTEKIIDIQDIVGVRFDLNNNLWLASENGLYLCESGQTSAVQYISGVEFNRGAMTLHQDRLYVGSTTGLYEVDFQNVIRGFIPMLAKSDLQLKAKPSKFLWILIPLLTLIALLAFIFLKRNKLAAQNEEIENSRFSLDTLKKLIIEKGILSVDELAEQLGTNTVQLNRMFKEHNNTPGKFLKTIKLEWAHEMLSKDIPMHEVVKKVGYSANFIKMNSKSSS